MPDDLPYSRFEPPSRRQQLLHANQIHTPEEAQIQFSNPAAPNSPVYIVSDKAYDDASAITGGAQGISFPQGMTLSDKARAMTSPVGRQVLKDILAGKDPAVVAKKYGWSPVMMHEMMHQTVGDAPSKLDPAAVKSLIPQSGWENMVGTPGTQAPLAAAHQPGPYGYTAADAQYEIPARLATEPESVGMTPATSQTALARYREFLLRAAPEKVPQFDKYVAGLRTPTK